MAIILLILIHGGFDPAAAEEDVVVVDDDGLAGCDGGLWGIEADEQVAIGRDRGLCGLGVVVVADFGGAADGAGASVQAGGEEIGLAGDEGRVQKGVARAEGDAVGSGVDVGDVDGVSEGNADAFALADGEILIASVAADDRSVGGDEIALTEGLRRAALEQRGVILVGDKADLLGIGLVVDGEIEFLRDGADLVFFEIADGQERVIEGLAGHAEENVALVLAVIEATGEGFFAGGRVGGDAGVMAGCDEISADGLGVTVEAAELEPIVAADAGVGGAAAVVFIDEVIDDAGEFVLEIEDVKGDA